MTHVFDPIQSKVVTSVFMHNDILSSPSFNRPNTIGHFPAVSVYTGATIAKNGGGGQVLGEQFWPKSWYEVPAFIQNGIGKSANSQFLTWGSCQEFVIVNTDLGRDGMCVDDNHDESVPCGRMLEVGNIVMSSGNDIHWVKECWYVGAYLVVSSVVRWAWSRPLSTSYTTGPIEWVLSRRLSRKAWGVPKR